MVKRPPFLQSIEGFLDKPITLPAHDFHIGENDHACLDQLPPFRPMAFFVIGKNPVQFRDGRPDTMGLGVISLGWLIADALFKLMRPWPLAGDQLFIPDAGDNYIDDIGDGLLPLSPKVEYVRHAYLSRVCELLDIGLHSPERLPAIIANIDALTNERLTERARAILLIGDDPGHADLWESADLHKLGEDRHE